MGAGQQRSQTELEQDSFERLLSRLGGDRDRAGFEYESLRRRLHQLFEWRGVRNPEVLVDTVFDRFARRLAEPQPPETPNVWVYLHGIAMNVLREQWRAAARTDRAIAQAAWAVDPARPVIEEEKEILDQNLACLERCMERMPEAARELVAAYHAGGGGVRIRARKRLAEDLGIELNALRIRMSRLRCGLERCIRKCGGCAGEVK